MEIFLSKKHLETEIGSKTTRSVNTSILSDYRDLRKPITAANKTKQCRSRSS